MPSTSNTSAMRNSTLRSRIAACIEVSSVIPSLRGISVVALRSLAALGMTFMALGMTFMAISPTAHADELVLDNSMPGVQVTGPWTVASLTRGYSGSDYLWRPAGSGDATVYWPFPQASSGGSYEVYARWTSGPNRATNAPYWVTSESGTVAITRNQRENGGGWEL